MYLSFKNICYLFLDNKLSQLRTAYLSKRVLSHHFPAAGIWQSSAECLWLGALSGPGLRQNLLPACSDPWQPGDFLATGVSSLSRCSQGYSRQDGLLCPEGNLTDSEGKPQMELHIYIIA